jgi:hypothetical protein
MKTNFPEKIFYDQHIGCFGEFDIEDPVCRSLCVLCLRCAIERDQNDRVEILEELVAADVMLLRVQ